MSAQLPKLVLDLCINFDAILDTLSEEELGSMGIYGNTINF